MLDCRHPRRETTINTAPSWVRTTAAWALDRTASVEVRLAAIMELVLIEARCDAAAEALDSITSDDPLGLSLRFEARNAVWANEASEIMPQTNAILRRVRVRRDVDDLRQLCTVAPAFERLNRPAIRRDWWLRIADLAASAAPYTAAAIACAVLLWMTARVAEGLPQTLAVAEYMRGM